MSHFHFTCLVLLCLPFLCLDPYFYYRTENRLLRIIFPNHTSLHPALFSLLMTAFRGRNQRFIKKCTLLWTIAGYRPQCKVPSKVSQRGTVAPLFFVHPFKRLQYQRRFSVDVFSIQQHASACRIHEHILKDITTPLAYIHRFCRHHVC